MGLHIIKKKRTFYAILFLMVLCYVGEVKSSGLACTNTYDRYFLIFDNGRIIKQDHNPAHHYWVGQNFIVFVDYMSSLRVWYQSHARELTTGISEVTMDDSMFVWYSAGTLRAWKQGETYLINRNVSFYKLNEGTLVFFDQNERTLNVWFDGKAYVLDENHLDFPLTTLQVSHHTVAWQTPDYQFKVFMNGQIISKPFYDERLMFVTGKNFCVVNNPVTQELEMLTDKGVFTLESSHAKWWKTKYDQLIYLNQYDDVKMVLGEYNTSLSNHMPTVSVMTQKGLFYDRGQQIFYFENHMEKFVVDYIPVYYYIFNQFFVFRNETGRMQVWNNGEEHLPPASPSANFEAMTNVLIITEAKKTSFWFNGKTFDYQ